MFSSYYIRVLLVPLAVIAGAVFLGLIVSRVVIKLLHKLADDKSWKIGKKLISSLRGMIPVWFGLLAAASVLWQFPLKPEAAAELQRVLGIVTVITITIVIMRVVITVIRLYSVKHDASLPAISIVENIVRSLITILGALMIFHNLGISVTPVLTALGVGGLAVALALQDTLSNLFAGVYIIVSRQISPGDYVKLSSGEEGFITDIAWRVTTLRTTLDSLIIVPNSKLSSSIVTNYDRPHTSNCIRIDFDIKRDNVGSFEAGLRDAAKAIAGESKYITTGREPVIRYASLNDEKITISLVLELQQYALRDDARDYILRRIASYNVAGTRDVKPEAHNEDKDDDGPAEAVKIGS